MLIGPCWMPPTLIKKYIVIRALRCQYYIWQHWQQSPISNNWLDNLLLLRGVLIVLRIHIHLRDSTMSSTLIWMLSYQWITTTITLKPVMLTINLHTTMYCDSFAFLYKQQRLWLANIGAMNLELLVWSLWFETYSSYRQQAYNGMHTHQNKGRGHLFSVPGSNEVQSGILCHLVGVSI